ncbi:MAG: hypothetical protein NUW01_13575 [Gemmatimonadaceae bacterium]|nr:hypothetical protein [Gemmatimonadaceae bacterium]
MTSFHVRVEKSGPLFAGNAPAIVHRAAQRTVATLVEMGESKLSQMLRPRPAGVFLSVGEARPGQASKGHYRRNLHTMVEDLRGVISDGGVVYGPWLAGVGSRNDTTRFKGYTHWRQTVQEIEKQKPIIAKREVAAVVRELNGG